MVTIECKCKVCKANGASQGKALPLRAQAPAVMVAAVKGKVHGLVHMAHDPNAVTGEAARQRTNVRPII